MLLMSSSVLTRKLTIFEVCDLGYDSVVTAIDLNICNISVLAHYHLEGSGEMRTFLLHNDHNLDIMDNLHSSLNCQDSINNREQDYGVIHVASMGTLLRIASRNLIPLRLCFGKRWSNLWICSTRLFKFVYNVMNPNMRQMSPWKRRKRKLKSQPINRRPTARTRLPPTVCSKHRQFECSECILAVAPYTNAKH